MLPTTSHLPVPAGLRNGLPASYDQFLRASVGVQPNGMELSVLSLLARMGKDPWAEAVRLRTLRREAAVDAIAAMMVLGALVGALLAMAIFLIDWPV